MTESESVSKRCAIIPGPPKDSTGQSLSVDLTYESLRGSYREASRLGADERCLHNMWPRRVAPHCKFSLQVVAEISPCWVTSAVHERTIDSYDFSIVSPCILLWKDCGRTAALCLDLVVRTCNRKRKVDSAEVKVPEVWSQWVNNI